MAARFSQDLARALAEALQDRAPEEGANPGSGFRDPTPDTETEALHAKMAELERRNAQLTEAKQEQAEFTYALSHDFVSPLNTIGMMLDILDEDCAGQCPEVAEPLDAARKTAKRMKQVVEDVLGYASAMGQEAPHESVDLNEIVQEILADLQSDLDHAQATVDLSPLPLVRGTKTQLRMLFQNLISNGIKFRHPDRPAHMRIKPVVQMLPDGVGIVIEDNGIGIEPAHFERIFGLFERLHTHEEIPGTGLGLALCRRIVRTHGGTIRVASTPGEGTEFTVALQGAAR